MKVSPLDAELNSESNGLVFMDGTYFFKKFLAENLFRRASFSSMNSTRFNMLVLTKCRILIGYLYSSRYDLAFLGTREYEFH